MSIGSAFGIWGSLEAEFHFWRQMNEKIPIMGQPRTTPGIEVKVFSMMSAFNCELCMKKKFNVACGLGSGLTLEGFRLARSIATAPPSD